MWPVPTDSCRFLWGVNPFPPNLNPSPPLHSHCPLRLADFYARRFGLKVASLVYLIVFQTRLQLSCEWVSVCALLSRNKKKIYIYPYKGPFFCLACIQHYFFFPLYFQKAWQVKEFSCIWDTFVCKFLSFRVLNFSLFRHTFRICHCCLNSLDSPSNSFSV